VPLIAAVYFIDSIPEQHQITVIVIAVLAAIAGIIRFQSKRIENVEEYFTIKKAELGPTEYQKMLQYKHAMISSQIHMRKEKGVSDDPKLAQMAGFLEKLIAEN